MPQQPKTRVEKKVEVKITSENNVLNFLYVCINGFLKFHFRFIEEGKSTTNIQGIKEFPKETGNKEDTWSSGMFL
jgi:hypothetical protein